MPEVPLTRPTDEAPALTILPPEPASFPGFSDDAFSLLDRLRRNPHLDQYRKEKEGIDRWLKRPFMAYRDDLVLGYVIPNQLALETERNVFSRLLKNDFGRGGCHHHYWMSFYRPGWTRLRDLQLIHSLHPDAFYVGVSASRVSTPVLSRARRQLVEYAHEFRAAAAPVMEKPGWQLTVRRGEEVLVIDDLSDSAAWADAHRITALRLMRRFSREDVLQAGSRLVHYTLEAVAAVWPVYQLLLPDHS